MKWYQETNELNIPALLEQRLKESRDSMAALRKKWRRYSCMYQNRDPDTVGSGDSDMEFDVVDGHEATDGLSYNMIARIVDTLTSHLTLEQNRVRFCTTDASDLLQMKAVNQTRYIDAVLSEQRWVKKAPKIIRQALLYGKGCVRVEADKAEGRVTIRPVPLHQVFIPRSETYEDRPTEAFMRYPMDREVAKERYPLWTNDISGAKGAYIAGETCDDQVWVQEGWKSQPHVKGKKKGKHIIVIAGRVCENEPWPYPVPLIFHDAYQQAGSWWSRCVPDLLVEKQLNINAMVRDKMRMVHEAGYGRLFVHKGTQFTHEGITDELGSIVEYMGDRPPQYDVAARVTCSEVDESIERNVSQCYDEVGLNELMAGGMVPSNIKSGRGAREVANIGSRRFAEFSKQLGEFGKDLAEAIFSCAKVLYTSDTPVKLQKYDGTLNDIKWSEIDVPGDQYYIQAYSTSTLMQQPAGRQDFIEELLQAGYIGPDTAYQLQGALDVDGFVSQGSAMKRAAMSIVRECVEGTGDIPLPDQFMDDKECFDVAMKTYNDLYSRRDVYPEAEKKMGRLRELMRMISDQNNVPKTEAPVPQEQPAAPQTPMGAPAPPM